MLRISRRHSHFVYGVIQSGLTCAVAAANREFPVLAEGSFAKHWLESGLLAWLMMCRSCCLRRLPFANCRTF